MAVRKAVDKSLPKEFRRDGFTYRQIAREGNAAIYAQLWTGCAEPSVCYEGIASATAMDSKLAADL